MCAMRVQIIDPSGDVAPYDHALAAALAARGAGVELVTSRFVHGPAAGPVGYSVRHDYYRLATRLAPGRPRLRRALKLAEHVPDTLRARSREGAADVRHHQWFPLPRLDSRLLGPARPRVLTLHNVLRAERLRAAAAATAWTRWWCTPGAGPRTSPHAGGLAGGPHPGDPPRRLRAPDPPAG